MWYFTLVSFLLLLSGILMLSTYPVMWMTSVSVWLVDSKWHPTVDSVIPVVIVLVIDNQTGPDAPLPWPRSPHISLLVRKTCCGCSECFSDVIFGIVEGFCKGYHEGLLYP